MLRILLARLSQGHRTAAFPDQEPTLPDRLRGRPRLDPSRCADGCQACVDACPTGALSIVGPSTAPSAGRPQELRPGANGLALDMGRCLFCTDCQEACPEGAIEYTPEYRLASRTREGLIVSPGAPHRRALELGAELRKLFGRSLKLRQVSAGGCNGCESDVNVLGTVVFDLGRFGIQLVASPRHADGLLITGPVTENMKLALQKTYEAVPDPKIVIAVGACAISGGPYIGHPEQHGGAGSVVPVDLYIPGCPPHPYTILEGLLGLIGRLEPRRVPGAAESRRERAEQEVRTVGVDLHRDKRSS